MKTIFLDFDGVLFDTVKEAYLLTRCAYDSISPLEPINQTEYLKFHKYRYLITKSWHFYYIMKLIKKHVSDNNFEIEYNQVIEHAEHKDAEIFDQKYIIAREDLIKTNYKFWDNLDEPYPFFYKIKELSQDNKYKFIILTNKKRLPVENKLKKYALVIDLYANEDLQKYTSKGDFINDFLKNNKIDNATLIEDSSNNIESCACYNINGYLVDWGYISPNEKGLNLEQIIKNIEV